MDPGKGWKGKKVEIQWYTDHGRDWDDKVEIHWYTDQGSLVKRLIEWGMDMDWDKVMGDWGKVDGGKVEVGKHPDHQLNCLKDLVCMLEASLEDTLLVEVASHLEDKHLEGASLEVEQVGSYHRI